MGHRKLKKILIELPPLKVFLFPLGLVLIPMQRKGIYQRLYSHTALSEALISLVEPVYRVQAASNQTVNGLTRQGGPRVTVLIESPNI